MDQHDIESRFHDDWAANEDVEAIDLTAVFEGSTALEQRYIIRTLGSMEAKKILDVGAGLGETSVFFASRGAQVTMTDVSLGMLQFAGRLARHCQVDVPRVQALGEDLPFAENSFDIIYLGNVLHHVEDLRTTIVEVRRALKPGGLMVSIDPLAYNPVINVYRRLAHQVRTPDEHPLRKSDIETIGEYFSSCRTRTFWFLTLVLFLKFYLVDRVHPNADRYWKRIYRVEKQVGWWFSPLARLDAWLLRYIPMLRWWCWNVVVIARK